MVNVIAIIGDLLLLCTVGICCFRCIFVVIVYSFTSIIAEMLKVLFNSDIVIYHCQCIERRIQYTHFTPPFSIIYIMVKKYLIYN